MLWTASNSELVLREGMLDILIVQPTSVSRIFVYIDGRLWIDTPGSPDMSANVNTKIVWGFTPNIVLHLQHVSLFNMIFTTDTFCTSCIANAGQGFFTNPSSITNAGTRIDTGVRAD